MKAIDLKQIYTLARNSEFEDFQQQVKVKLTGQPETIVIDCDPVVVDLKEISISDVECRFHKNCSHDECDLDECKDYEPR
jgi:hypothetical protein